jgi:hypothetical protein
MVIQIRVIVNTDNKLTIAFNVILKNLNQNKNKTFGT